MTERQYRPSENAEMVRIDPESIEDAEVMLCLCKSDSGRPSAVGVLLNRPGEEPRLGAQLEPDEIDILVKELLRLQVFLMGGGDA